MRISNSGAIAALMTGAVFLAACSTTPPPPPPPPLAPVEPVAETGIPCADRNFPVYFASDQTSLDADAQAVIETVVAAAADCQLSAIEIFAHSDAIGSETINMTVSQRRADAVLDAIMEAELDVARIAIVALGEQGAITDDDLIQPMNRRVDVFFRE